MRSYSQKGLSLVELLVGLSTASIVGVLLIALLTQNSRIFSNQNAKITEGISLNNSAAKIEETIKSASSIAVQYPSTGAPQFRTSQNTLVLAQPAINSSGSILENTYDYLVIATDTQNNKILRFQLFPNPASSRKPENEVLATNLSKLEFHFYDSTNQTVTSTQATRIGYVINVNQVIATQNQSSSVSGTVNLRNN